MIGSRVPAFTRSRVHFEGVGVGTIQSFEELEAWRTARQLTREVYAASDSGGFARDFGLKDQMRRAAVSVMSNIAEGFDSRTKPMFIEFLSRAKASAGELRAQTYVALDVGYLTEQQFLRLLDETDKCSRQIRRLSDYVSTDMRSERANARTRERANGTSRR
jgi:four helix bundle protein